MPRCLLGLLHPIVARLKLLQDAPSVLVGRDGARNVREARVAVHGVDRALNGVERVALAHLLVVRDLHKVDVAVGGVLEREDDLGASTGVELERLEVRGNLCRPRGDEASRCVRVDHASVGAEPDDVLPSPALEVGVAAVERVRAVGGVRVGHEDVGAGRVAGRGHLGAVVPLVRPEARIEPGAAVGEPEVRHHLGAAPGGGADGALGIVARRGRRRLGVGAIGHLAVGLHPGGGVAAVWDLAASRQVRALGGIGAFALHAERPERRCQGDERGEHAAHYLRGDRCFCELFHLPPP